MRYLKLPLAIALVTALATACEESHRATGPEGIAPSTDQAVQSATGDAEQLPTPAFSAESEVQTIGAKMLLYQSDGGSAPGFLESQLVATGLFAPADIDIVFMPITPLPLANLLQYDCVLAWTDAPPPNPVAQGDRLKEYADAGGRVILTTYAYSPPVSPWELQGGIMGTGYSPFVNSNTRLFSFPRSLNFGTALTGHEILSGVADFTYGGNSNYSQVTLDPGALLIGSDNFGVPLIGMSASDRVVGVNVYPGNVFIKSPGVFRTLANACTARTVIEVDIDIKPGSFPNSINPRSNGVVPVAILGSPDFDVTTVDVTTLAFGPAGAAPAHDLTDPVTYADHLQDVNLDGYLDLVSHYRQKETGLAPGDTEACIDGATNGGTPIQGCDSVRVLDH
jgi:hypothetical protein